VSGDGDRVVALHCPGCRGNCMIAAVRLSDCQMVHKCVHCGDVTASQAFMDRAMVESLHAGNTPEQIASRH
jgi:hypothetical protein